MELGFLADSVCSPLDDLQLPPKGFLGFCQDGFSEDGTRQGNVSERWDDDDLPQDTALVELLCGVDAYPLNPLHTKRHKQSVTVPARPCPQLPRTPSALGLLHPETHHRVWSYGSVSPGDVPHLPRLPYVSGFQTASPSPVQRLPQRGSAPVLQASLEA